MGIFSQANNKEEKKLPFGKRKSKGAFGTKKSRVNKKSKKALASKEERDFLNLVKASSYSCIVCGSHDIEWHHLKFDDTDRIHVSTAKKNHFLLVPVCKEHHTGNKCSFHGNKKELAKLFTKEQLLKISHNIKQEILKVIVCITK